MKLTVPFYKQTTKMNCGPSALRMVISYFDKDPGIKVLERRTGIKKGKGVATIQIATAAALSGYKTDFYSKSIYFNDENLKLEFYQKYLDISSQSKELIKKAKDAGVRLEEKGMSLDKLLKNISEESIPIILLDWNVVKNKKEKGYFGHFVPIVGYDDKNVYVHNHGLKNPKSFLRINKYIFEKARKAQGTDEDIIIIHRN